MVCAVNLQRLFQIKLQKVYYILRRSAAILSAKRSAGVAHRDEPEEFPGFETQGRVHQKSKTEVSVTSRKGLMSPKNKKIKQIPIQGI